MYIPLINEHLFCKYFVRLSVGNATKGFATYGCCHPCLLLYYRFLFDRIIKLDSRYDLSKKHKPGLQNYTVTLNSDQTQHHYIGLTSTTFKKRYSRHKSSFVSDTASTKLSEFVKIQSKRKRALKYIGQLKHWLIHTPKLQKMQPLINRKLWNYECLQIKFSNFKHTE